MGWDDYIARRNRLNRTRGKAEYLGAMLASRGIPGRVWYSWAFPPGRGWFHSLPRRDDVPQRLGYDFAQAVELIESGTMDFMIGWKE